MILLQSVTSSVEHGKIEFVDLNELVKIKPYIEDRVNYMKENRIYYDNCSKDETGYTNLR